MLDMCVIDMVSRKYLFSTILIFSTAFAMTGTILPQSPGNDTWTTSDNDTIPFVFRMEINESFATCTLFLDNGTLYNAGINGTVYNDTDTTMYANFSLIERSMPGWEWFVNCTNVTTLEPTHWFLNIDRTQPVPTLVSPTKTDGDYSQDFMEMNVSTSDNGNVSAVVFYLYNTSELVDTTILYGSPAFYNFTGLDDGIYYINATVNDSAGNTNSTETRTITLDTGAPSLSITTTNGTTQYVGSSYSIAFTVSDPNLDGCWYSEDGGANQSMTCTSPLVVSASSGWHTIDLYANDTAGLESSDNVMVRVAFKVSDGSDCSSSSQCLGGFCVNGFCSSSETYCGDGYCESGEDWIGCLADCPRPPSSRNIYGENEGSRSFSFSEGTVMAVRIRFTELTLEKIEINPSQSSSATVTVRKSQGTGLPKAYVYVDIEMDIPVHDAWIFFTVSKDWMTENGLSSGDIAMFKKIGDNWSKLETTLYLEDDIDAHYRSRTTSFSSFAIGSMEEDVQEEAETEPVQEEEVQKEIIPEDTVTTEESEPVNFLSLIFIIAIVAVVGLLAMFLMR